MKIEKLSLEHKDLLYEKMRSIDTQVSEYSFANLYLFRKAHDYKVMFGEELFIRGRTYDGHTYLMPTVSLDRIGADYLRNIMRQADFLFPIPEEWLKVLDEEDFSMSSRPGDMDYVYTVAKMGAYPGRNLHKKRNLLKQFIAGYSHDARPLTKDLLGDAMFVLNEWHRESGMDAAEADYYPCLEALKLYEELVLCGGIYYADGGPAGFILGEELNEETFVLHFAKARKKFKGIYQYMYNQFAKILPPKYRYLNFEQDLDRAPLRIAKSSYLPDVMLKKVRVRLK
ncbi:MAG: DUF2156 domain-containing protein [Nitrospirae bacterium]|nr:MAG: DUF2156 domain-containing protein [Nitrospirota bacterium]